MCQNLAQFRRPITTLNRKRLCNKKRTHEHTFCRLPECRNFAPRVVIFMGAGGVSFGGAWQIAERTWMTAAASAVKQRLSLNCQRSVRDGGCGNHQSGSQPGSCSISPPALSGKGKASRLRCVCRRRSRRFRKINGAGRGVTKKRPGWLRGGPNRVFSKIRGATSHSQPGCGRLSTRINGRPWPSHSWRVLGSRTRR